MAATTISRTNIGTDDDGSGTTGTVINAAYVGLAVYDAIDALFSATGGITLNQAGGDAAILTLESSDVAHGVTAILGTSAYAIIGKQSANDGGLSIRAATEVTVAFMAEGIATTDNTTKSNAATAPVILQGSLKSGTTTTAQGANANVLAIYTAGVGARHIFDSDGDSHQDVGTAWTNFDAFDDVALLTALSGAVSQRTDPLKETFGGWLAEHRGALEAHEIVTINDQPGGDGSVFINWSRTHMLVIGAVRQLGRELAETRAELKALKA